MSDHPKERLIPSVLIVIGAALYVAAAFLYGSKAGVGATLLAISIGGAIQTGLLIAAAFLTASLLQISFGDLKAAALKFAGASLVGGGLATLIPFGNFLALFVFLGLVMWLFEVDFKEAGLLTVIYIVISFAVLFVLRGVLRG